MILDYEQKYKEALERARDMMSYKEVRREDMEYLFPELKESEDERIRKAILEHIQLCSESIPDRDKWIAWLEKQEELSIKWNKNTEGNKPPVYHSILMKTTHGISEGEWKGECWYQYRWATCVKDSDVLSWMELSDLDKQGEQKTIYKYEHKFDIGDWITCPELPPVPPMVQVVNILDGQYELEHIDGTKELSAIDKVENTYFRWTINDAKEGDVLHSPSDHLIWIYKNGKQYYACVNMNYATENIYTNGSMVIPYDVCPATKDEQTILFERIKEDGYVWNEDKKELIKL